MTVDPTAGPEPVAPPPADDGVPAREATAVEHVTENVTLDALPGHDLDQHELRRLVAAVARRPELWQRHVAFSDDERHYVSLHRDAHVDLWVLCWTPLNDTGWHDHDISSGAVAVVRGTLVEHNLAVGKPSVATAVDAGKVFGFGPEHIHRLTGKEPGSVSIHAYSPPLWRMGQYAVTGNGVLKRVSLSYADELRPLDDAEASAAG
ncbi:MAG: cysteine dioxygenase [Pseudonocardiaceae bacterium]|nr:cysteine dioxygenase [Pseudonocardiaceae bacterium]